LSNQKTFSPGIKDGYITDLSLPNESISCWIKFDQSLNFDNILISFQDLYDGIIDIQFKNILKMVMVRIERVKRDIQLRRSDLLLDGFLGFVLSYTKIPETELPLAFKIDLRLGSETVTSQTLNSKIIRPLLELRNPYDHDLGIDSKGPQDYSPIYLEIGNKGTGVAKNIILKVVSSNEQIIAYLEKTDRIKEKYGFFKQTAVYRDLSLSICGQGKGTIKFVAEYHDENGNFYSTILSEFPVSVSVEYGKMVKIPLAQKLFQETLFEKA